MSSNANQAPVLVVGGGIGGLSTALALSRKGIAGAGAGTGAGVHGDRRRHPARTQRVPDVRGARADRADVPLVRVSRRAWSSATSITAETIVDMKIDKRFHDKYHAPYGVIHRADMLNVILDACKKSNLIKLATSQKVVAIDDTGSGVTVKTETGETYTRRGADRLRRAVVDRAREDRRRRQAGRLRPHRLSRRAADLRMARGISPAQDDRLVRREDPSGALPAAPRRTVQPRRGVPLRPLRGGLGHLRRSGRAARALQGQVRAGAHAAAEGQRLEDVGAVRPPGDQELDQGPHHAAGRRRASDASVSRAGRQHRDGGCRLPRQPGRGDAGATTRRRSRNTRSCAISAPRACNSWRACSARSITPAASIASCATSCCANGARQGSIDMSWLYGHQPELPHVENVPMPPPTRLDVLIQQPEFIREEHRSWRNSTTCLKTW